MRNPNQVSKRGDFFRDVFDVVRMIPRGRVTSYGAIARYLGAASSARMVGYALNGTSIEQGVPAHRVVNRNGLLTGRVHFPEDYPMQQRLEEEEIRVADDRVLDFDRHFWDPSAELNVE